MFTALFLVAIGIALLLVGGELLLRGAVGLATLLHLTPAVIGLTVVAAGTSVPELAVSGIAAWQGKPDIAIGNVVGSNIFNICIILGLTATIGKLSISGNTIKLEYPVLLGISVLYVLLANDGWIGRIDALAFLIFYAAFTVYLVRFVRKQVSAEEKAVFKNEVSELQPSITESKPVLSVTLIFTALGIALLGYGADRTVTGAVMFGQMFGMSERIIGLTIVAFGTSLPEVVTSLVSRYRGRDDIAIANVLGSNLFNILFILGVTGLVAPIPVAAGITASDNWWMVGITILLFPIMRSNFEISRKEGKFLLCAYGAYFLKLVFNF